MNYRIAYLFRGKSKKYIEQLIKNVAKKFDVNYVYSGKQPAHITLKYRFETDNIKKVEKIIAELCNDTKSSYFEIGEIGSFNQNTLHLKVKPSEEMVDFEKKLIKKLNRFKATLPQYNKHNQTLYKNFHVGIAHHDVTGKFYNIRNYMKKYNKKFKLKFDRVYLIKKPKNKWIIHKEYKIK